MSAHTPTLAAAHTSTAAHITGPQWWRMSAMALPLAFVTLPLYLMLPHRYANEWQVPLAQLGVVLLCVRALDALLDPWLGQWCDRWYAHSTQRVLRCVTLLSCLLALGFAALWLPNVLLKSLSVDASPSNILLLASVCLVFTYLAATSLNLCHQSWGTRMGGDVRLQSRIVAWREGLALVGVVLASTLPTLVSPDALVVVFTFMLLVGVGLWQGAPAPLSAQASPSLSLASPEAQGAAWLPLQRPAFRALLGVFMCNGIASAVPATLVLFFIQDRIQAPQGYEARYLGVYFVAAALSFPLWLRVVQGLGLVHTWLVGMGLSILIFMWAITLQAGDVLAYGVLCAASGLALGADLVVPGSLLTAVIQRAGDAQHLEGRYLGWWQVATKLNLALAAGITLPALSWLGYSAGTRDADGLQMLSWAYGALPCALKLCAALVLWWQRTHFSPQGAAS